jgi:hypothetical protein
MEQILSRYSSHGSKYSSSVSIVAQLVKLLNLQLLQTTTSKPNSVIEANLAETYLSCLERIALETKNDNTVPMDIRAPITKPLGLSANSNPTTIPVIAADINDNHQTNFGM